MAQIDSLTRAQRDALAHVERLALSMRPEAETRLGTALQSNAVTRTDYQQAVERLQSQGRIVLAFHPDRLSRSGRTVAQGLLSDGVYKNQFETGLSSGATSGFAGGRRDAWERRLFGGMYHQPGVDWSARPKYGALFLVGHADGPCPRFGSCYFVLRPEVSARSTFTLLGSHEDRAPEQTGTLRVVEPVMAALAHHLETVSAPLGFDGLTLQHLLTEMRSGLPIVPGGGTSGGVGRALDSFVEAQVHGPINLRQDVEALVADASFHGTAAGDALAEVSSTYGITLRWHPGFTLAPEDFPEGFRGFITRRVAERIAVGGIVNAPNLGAGENDFIVNPAAWREFGSRSDVLTSFRRAWHVLVLFGKPAGQWQSLSLSPSA